MRTIALSVALLFGGCLAVIWWATSPVAAEEEGFFITFGKDTKSLHLPLGKRTVRIKPAFEDYTFMMFDLCEAMKLWPHDCMIYPMNGSLGGNAIATIADGNRIIVYDRELSPIIGGGGAMAVIAHEIGHHYCRHLSQKVQPRLELEADRFAGAAMRKAGETFEATKSALLIVSKRPSKTHPGYAQRLKAIKEGWENPQTAKLCRQ
mgnify:CR=1 FL=1